MVGMQRLHGVGPEVRVAMPVIRQRCEEIGRDPASLRVSVHLWWKTPAVAASGQARVDHLAAYRETGVQRVMALLQDSAKEDEALERFATDARAAGATLA